MSKFVPDGFKPEDRHISWAMEKFGCTRNELSEQTEMMQDHEFRRPYTDWQKVWRNWIRKAAQIGTLKTEHRPRLVDDLSEEDRQEDIRKWHEDMQRLKRVK